MQPTRGGPVELRYLFFSANYGRADSYVHATTGESRANHDVNTFLGEGDVEVLIGGEVTTLNAKEILGVFRKTKTAEGYANAYKQIGFDTPRFAKLLVTFFVNHPGKYLKAKHAFDSSSPATQQIDNALVELQKEDKKDHHAGGWFCDKVLAKKGDWKCEEVDASSAASSGEPAHKRRRRG